MKYKEYKPKSKELAKMVYSDEKFFKEIDVFSVYKDMYYCIKTKEYKKQYEICKRKDKLEYINKLKNPE